MVQVVWSRRALTDLAAIQRYIAQFSPAAALRVAARLQAAAASLDVLPARGRPVSGYRELTAVSPYIIRYRASGDAVFIVRIRHGARRPD